MSDFRKLRVWHAAEQLAVDVHRIASEMRGPGSAALRDQLIRAALSAPANIVEGSAHASPREFARFLQYALSSVSEVEGHLQMARDLTMVGEQDFDRLLAGVSAVRMMLHGLIKTVKGRTAPRRVAVNRAPGNGKQNSETFELTAELSAPRCQLNAIVAT